MESLRIQADAVIVCPSVVYRPGQIVVSNGRILESTAACSERADLELPGSMLSAGLVNAHTHLEFSDLQQPFPPGNSFPEWIGSVIRHRREMAESNSIEDCQRLRKLALHLGLAETRHAGVALVGDIVTRPWSPSDLLTEPMTESSLQLSHAVPIIAKKGDSLARSWRQLAVSPSVFAFPELIGLDEARFSDASQWAIALAELNPLPAPLWRIGLSPHAPYSIHFPTAQRVLASEFTRRQVTAMHVAESLDEREWLAGGSGPFREVFERLGVPADGPRASVTEIIEWLATRERALLIHGNYLSHSEIEQAARTSLSVVYCPRTHLRFGHKAYPLRRMLDAGINVVLGTDSRASNPDLNVWNEVSTARQIHPWVSPEWAFGAVTDKAAESLGVDANFGSLFSGRVAAINLSRFDSTVSLAHMLDELTRRENPFTPLADILGQAFGASYDTPQY